MNRRLWTILCGAANEAPAATHIPRIPIMPTKVHAIVWEVHTACWDDSWLRLIVAAHTPGNPLRELFPTGSDSKIAVESVKYPALEILGKPAPW